jgi:hypothetical protein
LKNTTCFLTLFIILFSTPVLAEKNQCEILFKSYPSSNDPDLVCQCGAELANLEVTIPKGTHLKAVCGGRGSLEKVMDLHNNKITLDEYSSSGGYPEGVIIYISGVLVLTGVVGIEPSNSGLMSFLPNLVKVPKKTVFTKNYLSEIRILSDEDYSKFRAPDLTPSVSCLTANATIKIYGLEVHLISNDHGGAYVRGLEVLKVSDFKKCAE